MQLRHRYQKPRQSITVSLGSFVASTPRVRDTRRLTAILQVNIRCNSIHRNHRTKITKRTYIYVFINFIINRTILRKLKFPQDIYYFNKINFFLIIINKIS